MSKKCPVCGSTEFLADGRCKPCRKAYMKKYRAENGEKIKEQKREYNILHADKIKIQSSARCKKWNELNPEKAKKHADEWAKANPEKVKQNKEKWLNANRDKHNITVSAWAKRNRPARRIHWHNYKARKMSAGGSYTVQDVNELMKRQKGKCVVCKADIKNKYHVDHVMPLFLGGSNDVKNIQLLCQHCNTSKQARHPIDFMQSRGFLI